jgi:hypothetical protein
VSTPTINIQVGDRTLTATKAHLKLWLQLSDTYEKFLQASKESSYLMMAEAIYEYLGVALGGIFNWHEVAWFDTVSTFAELVKLNVPTLAVPLMSSKGEKEKEKKPWEYKERSWYAWAHIFISNYGWSIEYVAELEIEDAVALLQEIELDEQFKHEFTWQLSEIAYPYNNATRKSEFKPLPRPDWMLPHNKEIKKVMIPRSMLPMGVVENLSGMFADSVVKNDT